MPSANSTNLVKLPAPRLIGSLSVEKALATRRSVRNYRSEPLTLSELSQLVWSAQGFTSPEGYRTAPSAGALYPLEVYVIVGQVNKLAAGIYQYLIARHSLLRRVCGDRRKEVSRAALHQRSIADAPATLLFCTVNERIESKYGKRGIRYGLMEIGHAAQNVCLQAIALGMGTVVIGAFRDDKVKSVAHLAENEQPAYLVPVGRQQV
jgi:SagB-type dehydrogenase family enzyme